MADIVAFFTDHDDFMLFALVGFLAQIVDGALGMAFGVISSSVLIATGVTPAIASASVHAAEIVTTGMSGASHVYYRNVDKVMCLKLAVMGVLGGITGAYLVTNIPAEIVKPMVSVYLCAMALLIIYRMVKKAGPMALDKGVKPLGFIGGFLDAMGGGGWGPMVVSTLVARGKSPRHVIGSVNLAEFFVTVAISITFIFNLELDYLKTAAGLIAGGALAAPLAGYLSKHLPPHILMGLVGAVVLSLGLWNLGHLIAIF